MRRISWGAVVGVVAVVAVVACGSDRRVMRFVGDAMVAASTDSAVAQPMTTCRQWQVARLSGYDTLTATCASRTTAGWFAVADDCRSPAGWEPFASPDTDAVFIRRCVDPAP